MDELQQDTYVQPTSPISSSMIPPAPQEAPTLSDQERKQIKLAQMAATAKQTFIMISRGLGKIVEELSSLLMKR